MRMLALSTTIGPALLKRVKDFSRRIINGASRKVRK